MAMPARKLQPRAPQQDPPLRVVKAAKGKAEAGPPMHYMECRALGHAWRHQGRPATDNDLGFKRPVGIGAGSAAFVSTCANCGTTRTKWIGRNGALFPAVYRYPDGYERRGEEEHMSHLDWRKAYIVRALH